MSRLNDVSARIERAEHVAVAKAMCGQWTAADEAELTSLYRERRKLLEEGEDYG